MKTRRAEASSPNSDPQFFWNEYLQKWTDLKVNCIAEAQFPLCQDKPSIEYLKKDRIRKIKIDLRADLLKTWSEKEKELFTQRFIEDGKDFTLIADALPGKTVAQCIQYYYLTKHRFGYKKLRKKVIDGARIRRARSCGGGKGTKRHSQRFANTDKVTKEKLRKTYSCPEPNTIESEEFIGESKSRINEGCHSSKHMKRISENASGGMRDYKKSLSSKMSEDVMNGDIVDTAKRRLTKVLTRRKGSTKLSTTLDQCFGEPEYINSQATNVKINKALGKTPRLTVAIKRTNIDPCNGSKFLKKKFYKGNIDSTYGVRPITKVDSTISHSSNVEKMVNARPGSSQAGKMALAKAKAFLKNKRKDVRKSTDKVTGKVNRGSSVKGTSGAPCVGIKDVIKSSLKSGKVKKRTRIDCKKANNERKSFKKIETKALDEKRSAAESVSSVSRESSTGDVQIKRARKRKNTVIADNCCSDSKRKRTVGEIGNHKRLHFSDRGNLKKLKQKCKRVDVRMKPLKNKRKKATSGHSSDGGNKFAEHCGKRKSRQRKSNIMQNAAGDTSEKRKVFKRRYSAAKHKNNINNPKRSTTKIRSYSDGETSFNRREDAGQKNRRQSMKLIKGNCDVGTCSATVGNDGILITVNYDEEPCSDDDCRITCVKGKINHYDQGRQKAVTEKLGKPSTSSKRRSYSDSYTRSYNKGAGCDTDCQITRVKRDRMVHPVKLETGITTAKTSLSDPSKVKRKRLSE